MEDFKIKNDISLIDQELDALKRIHNSGIKSIEIAELLKAKSRLVGLYVSMQSMKILTGMKDSMEAMKKTTDFNIDDYLKDIDIDGVE